MTEEASLEFGLRKIYETRNDLLEEIKHKYLNFVEHLLILVSTVTGSVSVSVFASLDCAPDGITSFTVGIIICAVTAEIKKYQSIIKKKKVKHDKIILL